MVRLADFSKHCFRQFSLVKFVFFVSRPKKITTFLRKNGDLPNRLLIFFGKETHSEQKT